MWISETWISGTLIPAYYTAMSCESTMNQIQPLKVKDKKTLHYYLRIHMNFFNMDSLKLHGS